MEYTDELRHYGVIGMKWGVRRGRYAQSYAKGVKKLKKLDAKSNERELTGRQLAAEASKLESKARRTIRKGKREKLLDKAAKQAAKGNKLLYKSEKSRQKGREFYKKMESTFEGVDMSQISKADVEYGKRYLNTILS